MSGPNRAVELRKLTGPLKQACVLAEHLEDFVLAAKLSDCIEWIESARYGGANDGDASR